MKNIHVLPTDKPSRLSILNSGKLNFGAEIMSSSNSNPQHIYITSDEEIKEGDWVISKEGILHNNFGWNFGDKKIILTTDQDLIKDGVQAIDDEFLEWFVKNPSCKEVEIKEEDYSQKCGECGETVKRGYSCKKGCFMKSGNCIPTDKNIRYKIIIPKGEPTMITDWLDEHGNPEITKRVEEEAELRESAKKYSGIAYDRNDYEEKYYNQQGCDKYDSFVEGAKWQQERMYSEEKVLELLHKRMTYTLGDDYQETTTLEWFKQFKKK